MSDLNAYENYFKIADTNHDGKICGSEAVSFFQGSNLPSHVLAQIWTYADHDKAGFLDRTKFYKALRLVTVAQAGRNLIPEVVRSALHGPAASKIPPPKIDNNNSSTNKSATTNDNITWPKFSRTDVAKYLEIFRKVDKDKDGRITYEQAMNLFFSWKVPRDVLEKIWILCDENNDGNLSLKEFCIAVYLMERNHRDGFCLPNSLPDTILHDETLLNCITPELNEEADDEALNLTIKASIETAINEGVLYLNEDYPPSAPPTEYPSSESIFFSPSIDSFTPQNPNDMNARLGTCSICIEDPVEGACIPCGHMAGCMGCLHMIKESGGECPICRTKIERVLKLYSV